jgi:hypothetical protein
MKDNKMKQEKEDFKPYKNWEERYKAESEMNWALYLDAVNTARQRGIALHLLLPYVQEDKIPELLEELYDLRTKMKEIKSSKIK